MELRDRSLRFKALEDYYSGLAPSRFDHELEYLGKLAEADRMMAAELLFMHWGEKDPTAALEQTKDMGFEGTMFYENIMRSWAVKRPQEAGTFYQSNARKSQLGMLNYNRTRKLLETIATEWARTDKSGALEWANLLEGDDKENALRGISSIPE